MVKKPLQQQLNTTKVYANNAPAKTSQGTNGKYVIIELSPNDANASTFIKYMGPPPPANNNNASSITRDWLFTQVKTSR